MFSPGTLIKLQGNYEELETMTNECSNLEDNLRFLSILEAHHHVGRGTLNVWKNLLSPFTCHLRGFTSAKKKNETPLFAIIYFNFQYPYRVPNLTT